MADRGRPLPRSMMLLLIAQLAVNFRAGMVSPILALFRRQQGLSIGEIGLLGIVGTLGWFIFEPLSGFVADRVPKRGMMVVGVLGSTAVYALYPYASTMTGFALLAFAMASTMAAYNVATRYLTIALIPAESRGRTYGRYLSVISLGSMISPLAGGYATSLYGYTLPFYLAAVIGLVALVAVLPMKVDDGQSRRSRGSLDIRAALGRPMTSIYAVRATFTMNNFFRENFLPIYLHESQSYAASETVIGAYLTVFRLTTTAGQAFLGNLFDVVGSKRLMVVSLLCLGLSYAGLGALGGTGWLYLLGAVQGVLMAVADMSMMVHLMTVIPSGLTGVVTGLYGESENLGGLVSNPIIGFTYDGFGGVVTLSVLAIVLVSSSLLASVLIKDEKKG